MGGVISSYAQTAVNLAPQSKSNLANRKDIINWFNKLPLKQAATRANSTAYTYGSTIRFSTASNQLVVAVAAGTSTTAAPSFNAAAPITDGTVTWWALGRESHLNADGYPIPTITVSATLPTGFVEHLFDDVASANMFINPTCPNIYSPYGAGVGSFGWLFNTGGTEDNGYGIASQNGIMDVIEFNTDAPKFCISTWNNAGIRVKVYADGYPLEENPTPFVTGNPSFYIVDFSAVGGRRMRNIRLEYPANQILRGIAIDAQSVSIAPPISGPKGLWLSDSYGGTVSNYSFSNLAWELLSERVAKGVGIKYLRNMWVGGIGYAATNVNADYTAPHLVANNNQVGWNPDIVICAYGINDAGGTNSVIVAAALTTWQTLRTQYPNAVIVVIGPWSADLGPNTAITSLDTALNTEFTTTWNDPNSVFISVSQDIGGSWTTGTGNAGGTLTGSGNADFYVGTPGTHPSLNGVTYLVNRITTRINAALQTRGI